MKGADGYKMYLREIDDPITIQYIILFTLAKADRRVTHSQLTCLTLDRCNISFTNFQIALDNLVGIGYVDRFLGDVDENMPVYSLTEKGIAANGFFEHSIPVYVREQIAEYITPFFEEESLKKSVKAQLKQLGDREFCAELALFDANSSLLELTAYGGDRKTAALMVRNFKKNHEKIYDKIMKMLLEEE